MQTENLLHVLASLVGTAIAAGLFLGVHEWAWLRAQGKLDASGKRESRLSLMFIPPNAFAAWLFAPVWFALYAAAAEFAPWRTSLDAFILLPALFAADLSYYWEHRCAHKLRWLWALYHGVHHTSGAYTVATAYRVSFMNHVLAPAFYLPWVLLGFDPLLVFGMQMFVFHYQAWVHTEMIGALPWLDGWMNTPANHRMHHSSAREHRDRNLGGVFMWWDRLFGTFLAPQETLNYGIGGKAASPHTLLQVFAQPLRKRS